MFREYCLNKDYLVWLEGSAKQRLDDYGPRQAEEILTPKLAIGEVVWGEQLLLSGQACHRILLKGYLRVQRGCAWNINWL